MHVFNKLLFLGSFLLIGSVTYAGDCVFKNESGTVVKNIKFNNEIWKTFDENGNQNIHDLNGMTIPAIFASEYDSESMIDMRGVFKIAIKDLGFGK